MLSVDAFPLLSCALYSWFKRTCASASILISPHPWPRTPFQPSQGPPVSAPPMLQDVGLPFCHHPARPWGPSEPALIYLWSAVVLLTVSWMKLMDKAFSGSCPWNTDLLTAGMHWRSSYSPELFWDAESCQVMDRWRHWKRGKFDCVFLWGFFVCFFELISCSWAECKFCILLRTLNIRLQ